MTLVSINSCSGKYMGSNITINKIPDNYIQIGGSGYLFNNGGWTNLAPNKGMVVYSEDTGQRNPTPIRMVTGASSGDIGGAHMFLIRDGLPIFTGTSPSDPGKTLACDIQCQARRHHDGYVGVLAHLLCTSQSGVSGSAAMITGSAYLTEGQISGTMRITTSILKWVQPPYIAWIGFHINNASDTVYFTLESVRFYYQ